MELKVKLIGKILWIWILCGGVWLNVVSAATDGAAIDVPGKGGQFVVGKDGPVNDIQVRSGSVIVLTDAKEVNKLIDALKKEGKGEAQEQDVVRHSAGFWGDIRSQAVDIWKRVADNKAFTLTNLYYFLGGLFATFVLVYLARLFVEHVIIRRLTAKTQTDMDDRLCEAFRTPFMVLLYSVGIYLSATNILLDMPQKIQDITAKLLAALIASTLAWGLYRSVDVLCEWLSRYADKTESKLDDLIIMLLRKTLKVLILVISLLLIGQNILGINITTLLAGAGIFGLAIAFAAQDTIANFFGSIMIVLDKPFYVGDRITVGEYTGVVKSVGFRSIRLETADGHMITLPNKKITESAIENITARPFIKFLTNLTLTYGTTPDKMRRAMAILHEILENHEGFDAERPPRIFFDAFNDWSLNLKVILWYHPGDWLLAMEWITKVNLEILQRFNDEGIEFAFPTNTTYLVNDDDKKFQINLNNDVK